MVEIGKVDYQALKLKFNISKVLVSNSMWYSIAFSTIKSLRCYS